ncbi:helix-turn-helix domain-containing protein [Clostridium culturomicium]|uniref:helix-turn-helix domain-containing protein n=1 Tax=Clostridium culturomicium TaxID=1499683 RepID=UPI003857EE52
MVVITDKHMEAIGYILEGKNVSEVAKLCNVSRTAIYNWLGDSDFKAEVERQKQKIKNTATSKITARLDGYIDELHKIAMTSKSEKDKRAALEYLVDRVLGKATTKVADVTDEEENTEIPDIETMLEGLKKEIV